MEVGQQDFYDLLAVVKNQNRVFTKEDLRVLPYDQLLLAASGNAGSCRCPLDEVIQEKQERRAMLIVLPHSRLERLKLESTLMEDVRKDKLRMSTDLPAWRDLTPPAQLYFKLICLENHPRNHISRIAEILELLQQCERGQIPITMINKMRVEFQSAPLSKPSMAWLRSTASKNGGIVYGFLSSKELEIVEKQEIRDYACHVGCFRPLED